MEKSSSQFYDDWCWICGKLLSEEERGQTYCRSCMKRFGKKEVTYHKDQETTQFTLDLEQTP